MYQSPRMRRLRNDRAALERLRSESSVFRFSAQGDPPGQYHIVFQGKGLWRDRGKVKTLETHRLEIKLGASYPRTMPEIRWVTPIYHPNISEIGMVCLGGYGTHWVPSVQLDELCIMLWDMARYHNYDIRSPYNRDAALWVANQTAILFPTDPRPLRDLRTALGRLGPASTEGSAGSPGGAANGSAKSSTAASQTPVGRVRRFVERYGRVFGNTAGVGSRGPDADGPALPANSELHALVTAEFDSRSREAGAGGEARRGEDVLILEPEPASPPPPPSPSPPPPQREVPRLASEDILFID
jgi:ubiquitin-protein ligase